VDDITTQLIINSTQPAILSYMEFDENDEEFKIVTGNTDSSIKSHDNQLL